jgi:hypothetical protein
MGGAIILMIGGLNLTSGIGLLNRAARAVTALAAILRHPTMASQPVLVFCSSSRDFRPFL